MTKRADIGSKRLASLDPEAWARWTLENQRAEVRDLLTTEFQWVSRESDVLMRVHTPEHGEFLLLNEVQLRYDPRMPLRIQAYAALARERYQSPVCPVLTVILPPSASTEIPDCFHAEFMGLTSHQDWRNRLLWEEDAEVVLAERRLPMVPFVPVLKGGRGRRQVERAVQILRSEARLTELEPLLAFFASFVMDVKLVQRIMRWDMIELRESPWYNQILEEGLEEGLQQGLQQGLRQAHQIALDDLVRVLRHRFGAFPQDLEDQLRTLETSQLRELFDEALDALSLEAFLNAVPQPPEDGH